MLFDYECRECGKAVERDFRVGQAPKEVPCPSCAGSAGRVYGRFMIEMNGAIDRKSTFGEEMKRRNERAGKRQRGRTPGVRTVAHDYGGGDIREVK